MSSKRPRKEDAVPAAAAAASSVADRVAAIEARLDTVNDTTAIIAQSVATVAIITAPTRERDDARRIRDQLEQLQLAHDLLQMDHDSLTRRYREDQDRIVKLEEQMKAMCERNDELYARVEGPRSILEEIEMRNNA